MRSYRPDARQALRLPMNSSLQSTIDLAWESRASIDATNSPEIRAAVDEVIAGLDAGEIRVAERHGVGEWSVNQWVKKAVLLSFRLNDNRLIAAGDLSFYDKVPTKFAGADEAAMRAGGVRVVPPGGGAARLVPGARTSS